MATDRESAKKVLYELDRGWEFGLISRVLLQNYELIRLALLCRGGCGNAEQGC
jgi:hypothetical protein